MSEVNIYSDHEGRGGRVPLYSVGLVDSVTSCTACTCVLSSPSRSRSAVGQRGSQCVVNHCPTPPYVPPSLGCTPPLHYECLYVWCDHRLWGLWGVPLLCPQEPQIALCCVFSVDRW